ncbi:MAG: ribonuclease H-like domain-containing protein [Planctomycetaceae bacterium]|nr:ribonuclease H-like domain-containing protein [Planctomycetaceae bacterium]
MAHRYLAFDIETAKVTPGPVRDVKALRPLGVCCAAVLLSGESVPRIWHGVTSEGTPSPRMTEAEVQQLVRDLAEYVEQGWTIITWNGAGFDFEILAEESGLQEECARLALDHVDMMFQVVCEKGFPIGLDAAARGMELQGKSKQVQQHEVPQFWADGRTDEVLSYLTADVRATLEVALTCEQRQELCWITQRGRKSRMPLSTGWLSVTDAMKLPLPDTSWMDNSKSRESFLDWLREP